MSEINCKNAELYMDVLLDDEMPLKDSIEIVQHIENCRYCNEKWVLNEETRAKLKHYIGSIKAPIGLKEKVFKQFENQSKSFYFKPALITVSLSFFLSFTLFFNFVYSDPSLFSLHNKNYYQFISNDIELLSKHAGVSLNKLHLIGFENANFKPHSAAQINKPFINKKISLIAFKNDQGQKISLCFLPKDHKIGNIHKTDKKTEIDGIVFHHGTRKDYHFAYWKRSGNTIALVSDSLTGVEMIKLAMPLAKDIDV